MAILIQSINPVQIAPDTNSLTAAHNSYLFIVLLSFFFDETTSHIRSLTTMFSIALILVYNPNAINIRLDEGNHFAIAFTVQQIVSMGSSL